MDVARAAASLFTSKERTRTQLIFHMKAKNWINFGAVKVRIAGQTF